MSASRRRKPLTAPRPGLADILGVSVRTLDRLQAARVIAPIGRPRRGTVSRYDVAACVRAYLAHRLDPLERGLSARDRYQTALAELRELDLAERRGELVEAGRVEAAWLENAFAVREGILELPGIAVQLGLIPPTDERRLDDLCRDVLLRLSDRAPGTTREVAA